MPDGTVTEVLALQDSTGALLDPATEQGLDTLHADLGVIDGDLDALHADLGVVHADLGVVVGGLSTVHADLGNLPDLTGAWGYRAGVAGTPALPANCRILAIAAHVSTGSGSVVINGGDAIPIPANVGFSLGDVFAQMANPTVVFTGTDSFFISFLT